METHGSGGEAEIYWEDPPQVPGDTLSLAGGGNCKRRDRAILNGSSYSWHRGRKGIRLLEEEGEAINKSVKEQEGIATLGVIKKDIVPTRYFEKATYKCGSNAMACNSWIRRRENNKRHRYRAGRNLRRTKNSDK